MNLSKVSSLVLRLLAPSLIAVVAQAATASIQLEPVLDNLVAPIYVTHAHDGSNRLFIVEQAGRIKVVVPGAATPALFLDITSRVLSGGERGLLGLAFHPQFATNARFFVNYTRQPDGATVIAEYRASADPGATATSESIVLTIAQPFANHNGGMIEFGADDYLYIGMGDGGSANDPGNRAQNINDLLGKILRIDVDHPGGGVPYSSPPGNPFIGATPGRDEIFAMGMRNPFRFSFDRETGQLYVGDVGQGAREEIDLVSAGGNYGWRVFEGTNCTNLDPGLCNPANYVAPIGQYGHTGGRCSITGGYVYRGSRGTLPSGTYVFGDYCTGEIFELVNGAPSLLLDTSLNISSFGEDEAGEIYVVGLAGTVRRIAPLSSAGTTTALTSSPNPAAAGTSVTFTATVTGAGPTGVVNFTDGGSSIAGCGAVALAGTGNARTAVCVTGILSIGTHVVIATYGGDSANSASSSPALSQVINPSVPGSSNVALASAGGIASASSTYSPAYPVGAVNNNERAGLNPGNGGYWNDASPNAFPDWVQIAFNGAKTIDRVVVYSLQDNYTNPIEPGDTQTFTYHGITDFAVQGWIGSSWTTLATVAANNLVKRAVTFVPSTADRIRINVTSASDLWSRIAEIEAWGVDAPAPGGTNVALASAGAVASASSTYGAGYSAAAVNNNERAGLNPGSGGYWNDASPDAFPDWVQIDFNSAKAIDRVVVYSVQDNYASPIEPGDAQTFALYGVTAFTIQGWNGSTWITLATVSGNNLVKRSVGFAAFSTDRIRISVGNAVDRWSRIAEIEAWGVDAPAPGGTNVALASAGAVASASSIYSAGYSAAAVNNNERAGLNPGSGGYWNDASPDAFPDWVQIDFNSVKAIDRVVVYSVQDNYSSPIEPSDAQTFALYGVTAFTIQGWNGSTWITLATVSANNLVKRPVSFAAFSTDRIRISVGNAVDRWSRIAEIEAWAP
jgi:hypothetical protein